MTKSDLIKVISDETGILRKDTAIIVDAFLDTVKNSIIEGKHIEIRGFGTYNLKTRKPRSGRNPKTGERIPVPERTVATFKFSRSFNDEVMEAVNKNKK